MALSRRQKKLFAGGLFSVAIPLSLWSATYSEPFRIWKLGRASDADLIQEAPKRLNDALHQLELGRRLIKNGEGARAVPYLARAYGLDPNRWPSADAYSQSLLQAGQITSAFAVLSQFVRLNPQNAEARLGLAQFYAAQGAFQRASEEAAESTKLDAGSSASWMLLAEARRQLNQPPGAVEAARRAVACADASPAALILLGDLLLGTGDTRGARINLEKAVAKDSKSAAGHTLLARACLEEPRNLELAERSARRTTELAPDSSEGFLLLGRVALAKNGPISAVAPLEAAARLSPDDPRPATELRRALLAASKPTEAAAWEAEERRRQKLVEDLRRLEDARRQNPGDPKVFASLARYWAERGDVVKTIRYRSSALRQEQDAPKVLVSAVRDLTLGGRTREAIALIERVLATEKKNPEAYEAYADALLAQGLGREAALQYDQATVFWPKKRDDYQKRLEAFFATSKVGGTPARVLLAKARRVAAARVGPATLTEEVRSLVARAVELAPDDAVVQREWLRVLFERREWAEARKAGEILLKLSPGDTVGHAIVAVLLLEDATTEAQRNVVQGHLNIAKQDPTIEPLVLYGAGVMANQRKQGDVAVTMLRKAAALAPTSDPILFALASAERLAGNEAAAKKALAEYEARLKTKERAVQLLGAISDSPEKPETYDAAVAFFTKQGQREQAAAIQAERRRRFGDAPKGQK